MRLFAKWRGRKIPSRPRTAIVLGGGGIRGLAHLGILKHLERQGHDSFDFFVGTSAGAVFGALYLLSEDADQAIHRVIQTLEILKKRKSLIQITTKKSNFLSNLKERVARTKSLFSLSVIDEIYLKEFLVALIGEGYTFSGLNKPLYVVATDLVSGKDVVFSRGDLIPALMASSAIPGAFPPQRFKEYCLIDGGSTQKLPAGIARKLGAERILAVDVGSPFQKKNEFTSSPQIIARRA